eukprot:1148995-Pelagomonas_calceolata.AAC.1
MGGPAWASFSCRSSSWVCLKACRQGAASVEDGLKVETGGLTTPAIGGQASALGAVQSQARPMRDPEANQDQATE